MIYFYLIILLYFCFFFLSPGKIVCVLICFAFPEKVDVFFKRNYVKKPSPPGYSCVFFLHKSPLKNLRVFLKSSYVLVSPGKKIFYKNSSSAASMYIYICYKI